jgi:hypothetical protein
MSGRGMSQKSIDLIEQSRSILAAIHPTTVRGVAYQLFTRGLIESMGDKCRTSPLRLATRCAPMTPRVRRGRSTLG